MKLNNLFMTVAVAAILSACSGGDVDVSPVTQDNSVDNSSSRSSNTSEDNPCASYLNEAGQTVQGSYDGTDCTYSASFVDAGNALEVDLVIPALDNGGAHIFQGSLYVGENFNNDADLQAAGISKGGDGPELTIEAGTTIAFTSNNSFMVINRGSQILAIGTENEPITITSTSDLDGSAEFDAVQQWGGMVINGFGVTNKCSYTGSVAGGDLATSDCHVRAEGSTDVNTSHYGGANNLDNSGRLEYVVVKHTGAEVASGDELNGISFGGVGSGTIVKNLETYSTFDDGIEMFGGAVNINNFVAVYVRDDSIDIDEGYSGTIENALVIQGEADGNHCIESDGIGSFSDQTDAAIENIISQGINSRPTIRNLTCLVSANEIGTHDPGAGWRFREGIFPTVEDSMVVAAFGADADGVDNYCLRIDNRSLQAAQDGDLTLASVIFSCVDKTKGNTLPNGTTTEDFATNAGNIFATTLSPDDPTATSNTSLQLLEGTPPIYSINYDSMVVDDSAPAGAPQNGSYIGALNQGDVDWTANWTYGIHDGSRGTPLWFE